MSLEIDGKRVCTCKCHRHGIRVRHFSKCCDLSYKKYMDKDNAVDVDAFKSALEEHALWKQEQKNKERLNHAQSLH